MSFGPSSGFAYPDGLVITVVSATRFTPGANAAGFTTGDVAVRVRLSIVNGTKGTFDASHVQVTLFAGPNSDESEPITDNSDVAGFVGSIAAGQTSTVALGFDVSPANLPTVSIAVAPDSTRANTTFNGDVSS